MVVLMVGAEPGEGKQAAPEALLADSPAAPKAAALLVAASAAAAAATAAHSAGADAQCRHDRRPHTRSTPRWR